tara:strand:- start:69 stop:3578 length:3510 start_codon:yes stop_codon:yes gene_type:complete
MSRNTKVVALCGLLAILLAGCKGSSTSSANKIENPNWSSGEFEVSAVFDRDMKIEGEFENNEFEISNTESFDDDEYVLIAIKGQGAQAEMFAVSKWAHVKNNELSVNLSTDIAYRHSYKLLDDVTNSEWLEYFHQISNQLIATENTSQDDSPGDFISLKGNVQKLKLNGESLLSNDGALYSLYLESDNAQVDEKISKLMANTLSFNKRDMDFITSRWVELNIYGEGSVTIPSLNLDEYISTAEGVKHIRRLIENPDPALTVNTQPAEGFLYQWTNCPQWDDQFSCDLPIGDETLVSNIYMGGKPLEFIDTFIDANEYTFNATANGTYIIQNTAKSDDAIAAFDTIDVGTTVGSYFFPNDAAYITEIVSKEDGLIEVKVENSNIQNAITSGVIFLERALTNQDYLDAINAEREQVGLEPITYGAGKVVPVNETHSFELSQNGESEEIKFVLGKAAGDDADPLFNCGSTPINYDGSGSCDTEDSCFAAGVAKTFSCKADFNQNISPEIKGSGFVEVTTALKTTIQLTYYSDYSPTNPIVRTEVTLGVNADASLKGSAVLSTSEKRLKSQEFTTPPLTVRVQGVKIGGQLQLVMEFGASLKGDLEITSGYEFSGTVGFEYTRQKGFESTNRVDKSKFKDPKIKASVALETTAMVNLGFIPSVAGVKSPVKSVVVAGPRLNLSYSQDLLDIEEACGHFQLFAAHLDVEAGLEKIADSVMLFGWLEISGIPGFSPKPLYTRLMYQKALQLQSDADVPIECELPAIEVNFNDYVSDLTVIKPWSAYGDKVKMHEFTIKNTSFVDAPVVISVEGEAFSFKSISSTGRTSNLGNKIEKKISAQKDAKYYLEVDSSKLPSSAKYQDAVIKVAFKDNVFPVFGSTKPQPLQRTYSVLKFPEERPYIHSIESSQVGQVRDIRTSWVYEAPQVDDGFLFDIKVSTLEKYWEDLQDGGAHLREVMRSTKTTVERGQAFINNVRATNSYEIFLKLVFTDEEGIEHGIQGFSLPKRVTVKHPYEGSYVGTYTIHCNNTMQTVITDTVSMTVVKSEYGESTKIGSIRFGHLDYGHVYAPRFNTEVQFKLSSTPWEYIFKDELQEDGNVARVPELQSNNISFAGAYAAGNFGINGTGMGVFSNERTSQISFNLKTKEFYISYLNSCYDPFMLPNELAYEFNMTKIN